MDDRSHFCLNDCRPMHIGFRPSHCLIPSRQLTQLHLVCARVERHLRKKMRFMKNNSNTQYENSGILGKNASIKLTVRRRIGHIIIIEIARVHWIVCMRSQQLVDFVVILPGRRFSGALDATLFVPAQERQTGTRHVRTTHTHTHTR